MWPDRFKKIRGLCKKCKLMGESSIQVGRVKIAVMILPAIQCDQMWRNFGTMLNRFGRFESVHLLSGKILKLFEQICYALG